MLFFNNEVVAAEVDISIQREYTADLEGEMKVKESRVVANNTFDRIIKKDGNVEIFTITALYDEINVKETLENILSTVKAYTSEGLPVTYTTEFRDSSVLIRTNYPSEIQPGDSITFILEYEHPQLKQQNGALTDLYIQAFSDNFEFDTGDVIYSYDFVLKADKNLGEENFVSPKPANLEDDSTYDIYRFTQEQLLGNFVWIQRGTEQYYNFEIRQPIPATENFNTGNKNEFTMVIPRSLDGFKTDQDILVESISPEPKSISVDAEGNLLGKFVFPSHINREIIITGFAIVTSDLSSSITEAGELGNFEELRNSGVLGDRYFAGVEYWEAESQPIVSQAELLRAGSSDVYEIISNTYDFIVESIDYSQLKRFGINERQGALETLNGGAAVCMEYSDLYIALLRAQGIATRAAFGYGYDSRDPADSQELHQWVQVYIPSTNRWLNVDPTWGESGPALIGGDMNHFLTHVASINPNEPSTLNGITYGGKISFEPLEFKIDVQENLDTANLLTQEELLALYPSTADNASNLIQNTTDKFKAGVDSLINDGFQPQNTAQIIVITSSFIGLILLMILVSGILKIVRMISKRPYTLN